MKTEVQPLKTLDVTEYLKSDRQWTQSQRIQHAQFQKKLAKLPHERKFWNEVLAALGPYVKPVTASTIN